MLLDNINIFQGEFKILMTSFQKEKLFHINGVKFLDFNAKIRDENFRI